MGVPLTRILLIEMENVGSVGSPRNSSTPHL